MKKKLLSVLVAAVLGCSLFSAVPIASQAEETTEYTSGDWIYTMDDGICRIQKYNGSDTNVVVPSELDGAPVWVIDNDAFRDNKDIASVTIPDTVRGISGDAFYGCTGLANVDLGNNVRYLGQGCFCGCDSLTSIVIPASMTQSYSSAFNGPFTDWYESNDSLRSVIFESGGVKIPEGFFVGGCNALESVIIPDGITEIGESAFAFCRSLKELELPDSLQTIGEGVFCACESLKRIVIPDSVQTIESGTFSGCTSLEELILPDSLQTIKDDAFSGCSSLKEIILPDSVNTIWQGAFDNCSSLQDFYDYNDNTVYGYFKDDIYGYDLDSGELIDEEHIERQNGPVFEDVPSLTIHGYPGSNAEAYAKQYGIAFVSLTGEDPGSNPDDPGSDPEDTDAPVAEGSMFRLYNPNSGEHFYTSNATEKNNLVSAGWTSEGSAWIAPSSSNTPVYRVYNPNSGEHHYTMKSAEKDFLVSIGWNDEGIGWYSDDNQGTPLYRLYNPNATGQYEAGGHHYTKDTAERDRLIGLGWNDEGIGWYGV